MKNFKRDYVLDQESSFCTLQPKKDTCKGEEIQERNLSSLFTLGKLKLLLSCNVASVQTIWQIPHLLSGDSGGPLAEKRGSQYVLVGIISWGSDKCAQPGHQDVSFYYFTERQPKGTVKQFGKFRSYMHCLVIKKGMVPFFWLEQSRNPQPHSIY